MHCNLMLKRVYEIKTYHYKLLKWGELYDKVITSSDLLLLCLQINPDSFLGAAQW